MRNANLNVELVRKGYARVFGLDNPAHKTALQSNTNYSRLITRLLTVEQVAKHRGLGIWERSTWVERLCSYPSTIVQIVQQSTITKFMVNSSIYFFSSKRRNITSRYFLRKFTGGNSSNVESG